MIRTTSLIICLALAGTAMAQSSGKTSENPVRRLILVGADGDETYYNVRCRNNTVGSIIVYSGKQEVCATPQGGQETCKGSWSLPRAASASCGA